ncbi:hypothetical protein AAIR98_001056 [Elusimicrobium simillimum]|uniref:DUF1189 family protein n=1 Tax=Elusimicrobium simillimum TaxID=3143438 RepID=UPI003C6F8ABA
MALDILKNIISFKNYTLLLEKGKGYVFGYLAVIFIIMTLTGCYVADKYLDTHLPAILKSIPSIEAKDGALLINDGKDYTINLPLNTKSGVQAQTAHILYRPGMEFPPTKSDFTSGATVAIVTKTDMYYVNGEKVVSEKFPKDLTFKKLEGEEIMAKYSQISSTIKVMTYLVTPVFMLFMLAYWVCASFLVGMVVQSFMLRVTPRFGIMRLAVYVQAPVLVIFMINILSPYRIPLFNIAQLCISGMFIQQALSYLPRRGQKNAA